MAVVLYHLPNPASIYAQRTIHNGFKNAFINLGHEFHYLNSSHSLGRRFEEVSPDIFISSTNPFYRKFLNFQEIKKFRDN